MSFDGTTLTLLGKNLNLYAQKEVPGTVEHLIDELREKYNRPLPAADLLLPNAYDALMLDAVDVKDLGSGVIGGVECDYIAVRTTRRNKVLVVTEEGACPGCAAGRARVQGPYCVGLSAWKRLSAEQAPRPNRPRTFKSLASRGLAG